MAPALKTTISNGTLVGCVSLMALDLHKQQAGILQED